MTRPPDRVLVVMAKAPRPGRVKTRLSASYPADATVDLYRCLLSDTLDLGLSLEDTAVAIMAPADDLDDLVPLLPPSVTAVAQEGTGLAAALASVFSAFTRDRPRRVLAFNSDSPHLPGRLLEDAFDALLTHDVVAGPTDDGGYYLVGATASHEGLFDPVPMGTGGALASLGSNAAALGLTLQLTGEWFDVDVAGDLERLAVMLRQDPSLAPKTAACLQSWSLAGQPTVAQPTSQDAP